jgi:signal transduction histidine kinase
MRGRYLTPLPAVMLAMTVLLEIAAVGLSWDLESRYDTLVYAFYSVTTVAAGALVASRRPENPIGWLFCIFGLVNALMADAAQGWGLRAAEQGWPGGPAAEWMAMINWLPGGIGLILTFLLFPDGRLPGRRWRAVLWVGVLGFAVALPGWSLSPDQGSQFTDGRNPLATNAVPTEALLVVGTTLFIAALVASAVSLVVRFRRSRGVERRQLMWFTYAACVAAVVLPVSLALWDVTPLARVLPAAALTALPVAASVAILRYRLYDIDVVINRTLVYGSLTFLLGAVFAATTLALGTALGSGSSWATAGATLLVAVSFRPLRARVQDVVDRRFSQARYDARRRMSAFLDRLRAGEAAPEAVEGVLRDVLADPELELLFYLPESQVYVDAHGAPVEGGVPPGGREAVPIERGGQPLAMVLHDRRADEHPSLLHEVVEIGGLAIEIARLRVELRRQLSEVEGSRARIVAAANDERRRIERDLHDGAQQRLVSIGLALRHAQHELATTSADQARATLDGAVAEVAVAIGELRELSRGLPPSQLDAGLAPALRELAARAPMPVRVTAPSERFDRGLEAAAYFIACEGLTNAVKHAHATHVDLRAGREDGRLVVCVADDGIGGAAPEQGSGLRGLADRVAACGGSLQIQSEQGAGTALTAELPCGS